MNRTSLTRLMTHLLFATGIAAGLASAPLAAAGTGIVKCVAEDGHVTLTDEPCGAGGNHRHAAFRGAAQVEPAPATLEPAQASPAAAPTLARTVQMTRARMPTVTVARSAYSRFDPPSRSLSRDVSTLKAARQAMHLLDSAASSMRAQRIAGLR